MTAVLLVGGVGLLVGAGSADAKTLHPNWTDSQPVSGGRIVYRTTRIWFRRDHFSVTVTVTNATAHDVKFFPATGPDDPAYIPRPGFGLAWREGQSANIHTRRLRTVVPRSISTRPPFRLRAGKTVTLTFNGREWRLRQHRTWWLTFGLAVPWTKGKRPLPGADAGYWYSAKTFET